MKSWVRVLAVLTLLAMVNLTFPISALAAGVPTSLSISVQGGNFTPAAGTTITLFGTLLDNTDQVMTGQAVTFTSTSGSAPGSTTTDGSGQYYATWTVPTASGTLTVTAHSNGLSANQTLTIRPLAPANLVFNTPASMLAYSTAILTGTVTDQYGNAVANGTQVSLSASAGNIPSSVATANGNFSANYQAPLGVGPFNLFAVAGVSPSITVSHTVMVTNDTQTITLSAPSDVAAGSTYTISGTAIDGSGAPVPDGTPIQLHVDAGSVVSPALTIGGAFSATATAPGTMGTAFYVVAYAGAVSTSATVVVSAPGSAGTLTLSVPASVQEGGTATLTGTLVDSFGNPSSGGSVFIQALMGTLASNTVQADTNGNFSVGYTAPASQTGTETIQAQSDSVVVRKSFLVTSNAPPSGNTLALSLPASVTVGGSATISGSYTDSTGTAISGAVVNLIVSDGVLSDAAPVTDATGAFSVTLTAPTQSGSVQIAASSGSDSTVGSLQVTATAPATLALQTPVVPAGATANVTGTVVDQYGNPVVNGTPVSVVVDGGAPISLQTSNGAFTASFAAPTVIGTTVTISATCGAASDSVTATVTAGLPATITLDNTYDHGVAGTTFTISGTVKDTYGNLVSDGTAVRVQIGTTPSGFGTTTSGTFGFVVTIPTQASASTLTVTAGAPDTGHSNAFAVQPDVVSQIALPLPSSPLAANGKDTATLTGVFTDQYGNPVTSPILGVPDGETVFLSVDGDGTVTPTAKTSSGTFAYTYKTGTKGGTVTIHAVIADFTGASTFTVAAAAAPPPPPAPTPTPIPTTPPPPVSPPTTDNSNTAVTVDVQNGSATLFAASGVSSVTITKSLVASLLNNSAIKDIRVKLSASVGSDGKVVVESNVVDLMAQNGVSLSVESPVATVRVPSSVLATHWDDVTVRLAQVNGGGTSIKVQSVKVIAPFLTISLPAAQPSLNAVMVAYRLDNGRWVPMRSDVAPGMVSFVTRQAGALYRTAIPAKVLTDTALNPNRAGVQWLTDLGVVKGYSDNTFGASNTLTRAELTAFLVRALGVNEKQIARMPQDVQESDWFATDAAVAAKEGLVTLNKGKFQGDQAVSRAEMVQVVKAALLHQGKNDADNRISDRVLNGISETVTRDQAAIILERLMGEIGRLP